MAKAELQKTETILKESDDLQAVGKNTLAGVMRQIDEIEQLLNDKVSWLAEDTIEAVCYKYKLVGGIDLVLGYLTEGQLCELSGSWVPTVVMASCTFLFESIYKHKSRPPQDWLVSLDVAPYQFQLLWCFQVF